MVDVELKDLAKFQTKLQIVSIVLLVGLITTFLGVVLFVDVETHALLNTVQDAVTKVDVQLKALADIQTSFP